MLIPTDLLLNRFDTVSDKKILKLGIRNESFPLHKKKRAETKIFRHAYMSYFSLQKP